MSKRRSAASSKQGQRAALPPRTRSQAPFAVTSDGKFLINVGELEGSERLGRRVFIGVELTPGEQRTARVRLGTAAYDLHASFIERFEVRRAGQKPE